MAKKNMIEATQIKTLIASLKAQKENPWSAPPNVSTVSVHKTVPKINEDLEENEF